MESFSQAMRIKETASRREAMRALRSRLTTVGGTLSRDVINQVSADDALAIGLNQ